jgi:hypothetical protein
LFHQALHVKQNIWSMKYNNRLPMKKRRFIYVPCKLVIWGKLNFLNS